MNGCANIPDEERNANCGEPGMGDVNVMVKPSVLKDKTPMCLVNELSRHNKIQHQYKLVREEGPPHRKKFFVTLKLGDSEFKAASSSIKKAQHEAAAIALRNTKYKHPPAKLMPNTRVHITPTVELNALLMKRGELASYTIISHPPAPTYVHPPSYPISGYYPRNAYQPRSLYQDYGYEYSPAINNYMHPAAPYSNAPVRAPLPYKVSLKVCGREYFGEGASVQTARHKAAKKALDELLKLDEVEKSSESSEAPSSNDGIKSPISVVHEKAFRHNLPTSFEVIEERGPPHMKVFVTQCRVGEQFRTVGEGNGKKLSKKRAAKQMLILLESLPPPPRPAVNNADRKRYAKRLAYVKSHNRKVNGTGDNTGQSDSGDKKAPDEMNPVTMLMEYQKKNHAKEPVFVLLNEKGEGRRKRFSFEVRVDEHSCVGAGYNKKIAKKQASANMLKLLGVDMNVNFTSEPQPSTSSAEERTNEPQAQSSTSLVNGKQLAPGMLLVTHARISPISVPKKSPEECDPSSVQFRSTPSDASVGKSFVTELPQTSDTPPDSEPQSSPPTHAGDEGEFVANVHDIQKEMAKEQLMGLAGRFGCQVNFQDFPKNHHQNFLTIIKVTSDPPQTCYGVGTCTEKAQNEAAFNALTSISNIGVENLFSNKKMSAFMVDKEVRT